MFSNEFIDSMSELNIRKCVPTKYSTLIATKVPTSDFANCNSNGMYWNKAVWLK